ncbi:MAG: hypothetical protein SVY10_06070 [Thermodesulfobacteriota bacterium]|nr:hypothetical protein [Thermodesulfobacteriota bacterium]
MCNTRLRKRLCLAHGLSIFILLICLIPGCAGSKTYLIDLKYIPDQSELKDNRSGKPVTIGIKTFEDSRLEKENLGKRIRTGGKVDIFKPYLVPVNQAVTQAVKDHLIAKGHEVVEILNWDLTPETLSDVLQDVQLVVGGTVESLRSEVESSITRTRIQSNVKLVVYIGNIKENKVITKKIESMPEVTGVLFNPKKVGESLNQTITEAIERIFKDI